MESIIVKSAQTLLLVTTALVSGAVAAAGNTGYRDNNFSALGHEPDWQLAINNTSHTVQFTIGAETMNFRYPKTGPSFYLATRTTIYRVPNDAHSLSIRVAEQACRDSMTGKSHETTVVVVFDGKGYYGCGDYAH